MALEGMRGNTLGTYRYHPRALPSCGNDKHLGYIPCILSKALKAWFNLYIHLPIIGNRFTVLVIDNIVRLHIQDWEVVYCISNNNIKHKVVYNFPLLEITILLGDSIYKSGK